MSQLRIQVPVCVPRIYVAQYLSHVFPGQPWEAGPSAEDWGEEARGSLLLVCSGSHAETVVSLPVCIWPVQGGGLEIRFCSKSSGAGEGLRALQWVEAWSWVAALSLGASVCTPVEEKTGVERGIPWSVQRWAWGAGAAAATTAGIWKPAQLGVP